MMRNLFYSFFYLTISSSVNGNNNQNTNCGVFMKSSCSDTINTRWNKKNIGNELKLWLKGIQKLHSLEIGERVNFSLRKKVYQEPDSKIIRRIGNVDCLTKNTVGPVWRTAGTISKDQFHDGFLYGIEDETGSMTGISHFEE